MVKRQAKETPVEITIEKHSVSKDKKPIVEPDGTVEDEEDETDDDVKIIIQGIISSEETGNNKKSTTLVGASGIFDFLSPIVFASHPELGWVKPLITTHKETNSKGETKEVILEEIVINEPTSTTESVGITNVPGSTPLNRLNRKAELAATSPAPISTTTLATSTTSKNHSRALIFTPAV